MITQNAAADVVTDVELFKFGPVKHPAGDFDVDEEFARAMLEAFAAMRLHGYFPPILSEHNADGTILGIVRDLRLDEERGRIVADLELADGIKEDFEAGRRRYLSPSFYDQWKDPHTGEELDFVLREVSVVSVPHLKNIEPPISTHYTMSETGFATMEGPRMEEEKKVMEGLGVEEMLAKILEKLEAQAERIDAMEKRMMEDEEKEMMGDKEEMAETASAELAELKHAYQFVCSVNAVREELPTASREIVEDFARLRLSDPDAYQRLKSLAEQSKAKPSAIGYVGGTPATISMAQAHEMADQAGIARGVDRINWINKRFGAQIFDREV